MLPNLTGVIYSGKCNSSGNYLFNPITNRQFSNQLYWLHRDTGRGCNWGGSCR